MPFIHQTFIAIFLVTLTITLQSVGMSSLIHWIKAQFPRGIPYLGLLRSFSLVVRLTSLLVCLHFLEILLWASFYRRSCFSTWEVAFYFSAANYATVGAEGVSLQQTWRLIGPLESVVGVLMCGLSASFLFAVVTRLVELREPELVDRRCEESPALPEVRNRATARVDRVLRHVTRSAFVPVPKRSNESTESVTEVSTKLMRDMER